jgi:hypothetical protein
MQYHASDIPVKGSSPVRIAFLNPWSDMAENQGYMSHAIAARRIGLELLDCRNERELEDSRAEFVVSIASSVPKVCDYPTYLTVHEPTSRFLRNETYLTNLMTYDGYLTISDTLQRFIRDVSFGIGRPDEPGFYFDTSQRMDARACLPDIVKQGNLQVVYFGTNWDCRSPQLFELLDATGTARIHGPRSSWPQGMASYAGPLPFDGTSPQLTYAAFGLGLVLLSTDHMREDVISNRIFEISSVGAVSICPDIPWIRKWFGDAVFYFDQRRGIRDIVARVTEILAYCRQRPELAGAMGERARSIFERSFTAETMLANAVEYHDRKTRERQRRRSALGRPPLIAVILRCGGRDVAYVRRAADSVRRQSFGRFALIFVKHRDIDLADTIRDIGSGVERVVELDVPGSNRSAALFAGVAEALALQPDYLALLDDDDFWLSNHVESLFLAARQAGGEFDVAFSGSIMASATAREIEKAVFWKRNVQTFGYRDGLPQFSPNCFIARTPVLPADLTVPAMETAEDSLLVMLVARHGKAVFSYQATAFQTDDAPNRSGFAAHPQRDEDEISLVLRGGLLYASGWLGKGSLAEARKLWSRFEARRREKRLAAGATAELAAASPADLIAYAHWAGAQVTAGNPTVVETVAVPWGYSATLPLGPYRKMHSGDEGSLFWEIDVEVARGEVGIGMLDNDRMVAEQLLKHGDGRRKVHLPAGGFDAALMVRNGTQPGSSQVGIHAVKYVALI